MIWQPSAATSGGVRFGKDLSKQRRPPTARTPVLRGTDTRLGVAEMPSSAKARRWPRARTPVARSAMGQRRHAALQSVLDTGRQSFLRRQDLSHHQATGDPVEQHRDPRRRHCDDPDGIGPGEFDKSFNSQLFPQYRYAPNSVGIAATGLTGPFVDNVIIRYEGGSDDRYVRAIASGVVTISGSPNNDISNFSKSLGIVYLGAITAASSAATRFTLQSHQLIHDRADHGYRIRQCDDGSMLVDVTRNYIHDLTVGPISCGSSIPDRRHQCDHAQQQYPRFRKQDRECRRRN